MHVSALLLLGPTGCSRCHCCCCCSGRTWQSAKPGSVKRQPGCPALGPCRKRQRAKLDGVKGGGMCQQHAGRVCKGLTVQSASEHCAQQAHTHTTAMAAGSGQLAVGSSAQGQGEEAAQVLLMVGHNYASHRATSVCEDARVDRNCRQSSRCKAEQQ